MKIFKYLNRLQTAILTPFIIGAACLTLAEIFSLIASHLNNDYEALLYNLSQMLVNLIPFVFCYFLVLFLSDGKRGFKAFWCALCLLIFFTCAESISDISCRLFFGLAFGLFCIFCFKKFNMITALVITVSGGLIFGLLIGYINDYWHNAVMLYSRLISEKGIISSALFGISNTLLTFFGDTALEKSFFYNSFGGALFIDNNVVTGAKDLFSNQYSGEYISLYLSGHYLMLFVILGISIELLNELKGIQKTVLIILCAGAVLSGNFSLILIYFFLESPFIFLISLLLSGLSYAISFVLNLTAGYLHGGGIIEMISYTDNWVYMLASGVVFIAIGYFTAKYSVERRGISDCLNIYIPTRLNNTVKALGGIENIIRFKDNCIEVRNPKLINTVMLNCEIDENIVKSDDENFVDLKEYL